jgi:hypothetical protein
MNEQNQHTETTEIPDLRTLWRSKHQIAEHYGCDIRTITNLMRRRVLPYVKIGRFVRFDVGECDQAMEKYKRRSAS